MPDPKQTNELPEQKRTNEFPNQNIKRTNEFPDQKIKRIREFPDPKRTSESDNPPPFNKVVIRTGSHLTKDPVKDNQPNGLNKNRRTGPLEVRGFRGRQEDVKPLVLQQKNNPVGNEPVGNEPGRNEPQPLDEKPESKVDGIVLGRPDPGDHLKAIDPHHYSRYENYYRKHAKTIIAYRQQEKETCGCIEYLFCMDRISEKEFMFALSHRDEVLHAFAINAYHEQMRRVEERFIKGELNKKYDDVEYIMSGLTYEEFDMTREEMREVYNWAYKRAEDDWLAKNKHRIQQPQQVRQVIHDQLSNLKLQFSKPEEIQLEGVPQG